MKKLLLFDIDGTILNMKMGLSKNIFIDTFFDIYGFSISIEQMPRFSGNTDLQILNQMADTVGLDKELIPKLINDFWDLKLERFKEYCTKEYIDLVPGVEELLHNLSQNDEYHIALVTGNSQKNAYQKLSSYGLDKYFSDGAFGCENPDRNTLPLMAINRVNKRIKKEVYSNCNTCIIGDTLSDVLAAKTNNLKVVIIANKSDHLLFSQNQTDSIMTDFLDTDYFFNEMDRISN